MNVKNLINTAVIVLCMVGVSFAKETKNKIQKPDFYNLSNQKKDKLILENINNVAHLEFYILDKSEKRKAAEMEILKSLVLENLSITESNKKLDLQERFTKIFSSDEYSKIGMLKNHDLHITENKIV